MHIFRPHADMARVLVALAPLIGALLIAMSRLADYRHDVYDVTVGSVLGIVVAYFSYTRYYPSLRSSKCDTPYPSRADLATPGMKLKDEEAMAGSLRGSSRHVRQDSTERVPLRDAGRQSRSASNT